MLCSKLAAFCTESERDTHRGREMSTEGEKKTEIERDTERGREREILRF